MSGTLSPSAQPATIQEAIVNRIGVVTWILVKFTTRKLSTELKMSSSTLKFRAFKLWLSTY